MSMKQKEHKKTYLNTVYEPDNLEFSRELTTSIADLDLEDIEEIECSQDKDEAVKLLVSELNEMKSVVEKYTQEELNELIPNEARIALAERFKQDFAPIGMDNPLYIETIILLNKLGIVISRDIEEEEEHKGEEEEHKGEEEDHDEKEWRHFQPV